MLQAEAAGQYLQDVPFTNVFCSDMKRAKQVSCDCRMGLKQVEGAFELYIETLELPVYNRASNTLHYIITIIHSTIFINEQGWEIVRNHIPTQFA